MFQLFNHRFANAYQPEGENRLRGTSERFTATELSNPMLTVMPRYFVREVDIESSLPIPANWLIAVRKVTSVVSNEKTLVCSILPKVGLADSAIVLLTNKIATLALCLFANFSSLVLDYCAKQKVGGINLNHFLIKQFPVIPPEYYISEP